MKLRILMLCGLLLAATPGIIAVGCGGWRQSAHKTVGTVVISGEAAMQSWAAYVHTGQAKTNQEAQVKFAYERYQASMNAVIDVGKSATTTTNKTALGIAVRAATDAEVSLVNLIETFTKK
jgi:hypothetical protein